jgi:hypothetical protein
MKAIIFTGIVVLGLFGLLLTGCGHKEAEHEAGMEMKMEETASGAEATETTVEQKIQYICPMHAEVVSDKPGNCPKCGMNLEKKK